MNKDVFERVILPVGIPLATFVVVEIVVFSLSRVLLTAGKLPAVGVALGVALGILVTAAAVAARPRIRTSSLIGLLAVGFVAVVAAGGWAAARGFAPLEGHGEDGAEHGETTGAGTVEIVAENIEFSVETIEVPAGETFTIHFDNRDALPHNVSIYESEDGETDLFIGEIFSGPDAMDYTVGPLEAASYFFQCDVHRQMNGTVQAV